MPRNFVPRQASPLRGLRLRVQSSRYRLGPASGFSLYILPCRRWKMSLLAHERALWKICDAGRTWRLMVRNIIPNKYTRDLERAIDDFEVLYAAYLEDLPKAKGDA